MRLLCLAFTLLCGGTLAAQVPDILYYQFDETSGATAQNSAVPGQGYSNAVFSAPPNWNTTDPRIGAANVDNDGLERRLSTGYSLSERNGQPFTIEFWFRTTGGGYQDIVNDSDTFGIWLNNGRLEVWLDGDVLQSPGGFFGGNLNDGDWHYCAVTFDGNDEFTLYYERFGGITSRRTRENVTFSNLALELMHWQSAVPGTYNGEIDEFRLWGVERSQNQLNNSRQAAINLQGARDLDVFDPDGAFVPPGGSVGFSRVDDTTFTDYTFTLRNARNNGNVSFTPANITASMGAAASVIAQPSAIGPGATTTMTVRVTPTAPVFSVDVAINHDRTPDPYGLTIDGVTDTGLPEVMYYRLNEGSGAQAANEAVPGFGDDPATFDSGPAWNTSDPQLGNAASAGIAELPTGVHATDLPAAEFSIEFWMRTGDDGTIVGDGESWRVYLDSGDLLVDAGVQTIDPNTSGTNNLDDNSWHHVAIVSDPGNYGLRFYVDGVQAAEVTNVSFPFADAEAVLFSNAGQDDFNGDIDEFRFWAHARTAAEISDFMNVELFGLLEVQRPGGTAIPDGGSDPVGTHTTGVPFALDYVLENVGGGDLSLASPCVGFSNAVNCTPAVTSDPGGNEIARAATDSAQVEITANSVGSFSVDVEFSSSDPDSPVYTVTVTGTATGTPEISLEHPTGTAIAHQGGDTVSGAMVGITTNLTYTIRNDGNAPLSVLAEGHTGAVDCNVTVQAPVAVNLAPSSTTTMDVEVTPTAAGTFSFTLEVDSNDPLVPTYEIQVGGTAVNPPLASFNQDPVDYGPRNVGTSTLPYQHVVTNTGGADLTITAVDKSGAHDGDWSFAPASSLPVVLTPSAQLVINGVFTPGGTGARGATLEITSDSGAVPNTVTSAAVTGTGTAPVLAAGNESYPDTNVGLDSAPLTHTITNSGDGDATITGIQFTGGSHPADWAVASSLPTVVPANGSVTFDGIFSPGGTGARGANVEISWNFGGGVNPNTTTAAVTGNGTAGDVSSPATDYGDVNVGVMAPMSHTVTNSGDGPVEITNATLAGADAGDWQIAVTPGWPTTVSDGNSAGIDLEFTPGAAGARIAELVIHWNQGNGVSPTTTTIALSGNGTEPALDTGDEDYPLTPVSGSSGDFTHTIANSGDGAAEITSISFTGGDAAAWALNAGLPVTVAANSSETFTARFEPTSPGPHSATLEVEWNYGGGVTPSTATATVTGLATNGTLSTPDVSYPDTNVGLDSADETHTLTNTDASDVEITQIVFTGGDSADWTISTALGLPVTVSGNGGQFSFDAFFTPGATGLRSTSLEVTWNYTGHAAAQTTTAAIDGTGTEADLATPDESYPDTNVGLTSAALQHVITNNGDGPAQVTLIEFATGDAADWAIVSSLSYPATIAPGGGQLNVDGEFTPGATGARATELRIHWNQGDGVGATTTTANVTGDGTQASVDSSPDPAAYGSVQAGNTAGLTHDIENTGDGPAEVTLIEVVGGDSALWSLGNGPAVPFTLQPGAANAESVDGTFAPTTGGSFSTTLRIHWNQGSGVAPATTDVVLTGSATAPDLAPQVNPVDHGSVDVGQTGGFVPHVIENNGSAPGRVTSIVKGGTDAADFDVFLPSFPQTINPSSNLTFFGTFTPSAGGLHTATLTVTWDTGGPPSNTFVINLEGTGNAPSAVTGLSVGADTGGPIPVTAFVDAGAGQFVDVAVTYSGGANPGPAVISDDGTLNINGNVIEDVPANTQISFLWDAYATERHESANYVLTLSPSVLGSPGTAASSTAVTTNRGWAKHSTPFERNYGRFGHASVYDAANDRMIVFGGKGADGQLTNDVWAFEQTSFGAGWRQLNPGGAAPSARQYATAVYDAPRDRMILFGGYNGAYLDDAWELDLTRGSEMWLEIAVGATAPAPRFGHSMVYDGTRDRALVIGGRQGNIYFNDVWALDLSPGAETWGGAALTTGGTGPSGRWGHASVLDTVNNRVVIFGGQTATGQVNEVWELSLGSTPTWTSHSPSGSPPVRHFMTSGYDATNNALFIQSGYQGSAKLTDSWVLSLSGAPVWTQIADDPAASGGRVVGTAAFDTQRGRMVVYGGLGSVALSDVSVLDVSGTPNWGDALVTTMPEGRWGAAMAYDSSGQRLILWGGKDDTTYFNSVWALDRSGPGGEWARVNTNVGPAPRVYPAHAYDSVGNRLFIHGGQLASGALADDLWELDLASGTWTQHSSGGAGPRMRHAMVYDNANNRVVVHGGSAATTLGDAWSFTIGGAGWSSVAVSGISARYGHAGVYDSVNGRAVFFGGRDAAGHFDDLWAFDLDPFNPIWTDVTPSGTSPPPRALYALAADTAGTRAWVHGGRASAQLDDLWELDLSGAPAWSDITPAGARPLPRLNHVAAFDGNEGLYVGFGRADDNAARDLWQIDTSSPASGFVEARVQDAPAALVTANVALDEAGNRLVAFGGITDGVHEGDVYTLDLSSPVATWTRLSSGGTAPAARRSATMVYDDSVNPPRMILYGGRLGHAQSTATDELWALDLDLGNEQWVQLSPTVTDDPGARTQHTAVVDNTGRMVVFGGSDPSGLRLNDVFALDLNTLTWSEVVTNGTGPTGRFAHAAIYDGLSSRNRMIVHGGYNGASALGDAWVLDLDTDTWSSYAAPGTRYYHSMVVDPAGERVLMFGGWDGSAPRNELFELDLAADSWSTIAPTVAQPQERWAHAAAWDVAEGRMVIAGGYLDGEIEATEGDGTTADTWFWGD